MILEIHNLVVNINSKSETKDPETIKKEITDAIEMINVSNLVSELIEEGIVSEKVWGAARDQITEYLQESVFNALHPEKP